MADGLLSSPVMATSFVSAAFQGERSARPSRLGSVIFGLFLLGLAAGGAGFAFLAAGRVGWAQTLFVSDLVAMLSSVSLGAIAPRAVPRELRDARDAVVTPATPPQTAA